MFSIADIARRTARSAGTYYDEGRNCRSAAVTPRHGWATGGLVSRADSNDRAGPGYIPGPPRIPDNCITCVRECRGGGVLPASDGAGQTRGVICNIRTP